MKNKPISGTFVILIYGIPTASLPYDASQEDMQIEMDKVNTRIKLLRRNNENTKTA